MIYEDMLQETAPLPVKYRGKVIQVGYRPDRYTDKMHLQLRELRAAPDFSPLDPMICELVGEWSILEMVRDSDGNPMATDGRPFTDRATQRPATRMKPITPESVAGLPCFMKMAIVDAICDDVMKSAGNDSGTSSTTSPAGDSTPAVPPATSTPGLSALPEPTPLPTSGVQPALVTVPPLV